MQTQLILVVPDVFLTTPQLEAMFCLKQHSETYSRLRVKFMRSSPT